MIAIGTRDAQAVCMEIETRTRIEQVLLDNRRYRSRELARVFGSRAYHERYAVCRLDAAPADRDDADIIVRAMD